jgi:hypothetical protein
LLSKYPVSAGMLFSFSAFLPLKEFKKKTILGLAAIFNPKVSLKATFVVGLQKQLKCRRKNGFYLIENLYMHMGSS